MTASSENLAPEITSDAGSILSIYLNTHQADASNLNRGFETQLTASLNAVERSLKKEADLEEFLSASRHALQFVKQYRPSGRAIIIFANSKGVLQSRTMNIDVETEVQWGRPHVKPYLEAVDEFERQVIVVTDKWRGRILSVFLGTVELNVDVRDRSETKHLHTAGMDHLESQSHLQNRADENMKRHVRHIIQELEKVVESRPSRRIVCGGNVEALAELFRLLPKRLRAKVAGTASLSVTDDVSHLVETALKRGSEAERDLELRSVEQLQVAAAKGGKATAGIRDTLRALQEGRVRTLYYAEGVTVSGRQCSACSALFPSDAGESCGHCGESLQDVADIMDGVVLKAIASGSDIEQVRGAGAEKLRETGGIGAILRY